MTSSTPLNNHGRPFGFFGAYGLSLLLGVFAIPAAADSSGADMNVRGGNTSGSDVQTTGYQPSLVDDEYYNWDTENACFLVEQGPPLVRIHASFLLNLRDNLSKYGLPEVHCDNDILISDIGAIPRQALKQDPFNPVLIYYVYQTYCAVAQPAHWCASERLPERLQIADPDNAVAYLLPVYSRREASPGGGGFVADTSDLTDLSAQEMELLARAASAKRFDTYISSLSLEIHDAVRDVMADRPPFMPSAEAVASVEPEDLSAYLDQDMAGLITVTMEAISVAFVGPAYQRLSAVCKAAHENVETRTMGYCQSIGQLMAAARSEIDISIGEDLLRLADSEPVTDAVDDELWRQSVSALIQSCEMPKGLMFNAGLSGAMPEEHTLLWLEDRMVMREYEALREAAIREYALYPDDFDLDPARCRDIAQLPDDIQQLLLEAYQANTETGNDAFREAFKAAALALDCF